MLVTLVLQRSLGGVLLLLVLKESLLVLLVLLLLLVHEGRVHLHLPRLLLLLLLAEELRLQMGERMGTWAAGLHSRHHGPCLTDRTVCH